MGATKKGMHTKDKGKFEQLKMAEKLVELAEEEVEMLGDRTSKDKLKKAKTALYKLLRSLPYAGISLSTKAHQQYKKGGKMKKNYAYGGGVRPTNY
jgi:hypothetical protein